MTTQEIIYELEAIVSDDRDRIRDVTKKIRTESIRMEYLREKLALKEQWEMLQEACEFGFPESALKEWRERTDFVDAAFR